MVVAASSLRGIGRVVKTLLASTVVAILLLTSPRVTAQTLPYTQVNDPAGFYVRYYTVTCASSGTRMAFQTGGPVNPSSTTYTTTIDARADSLLDGGLRIMGAFTTSTGISLSARQGFDPCIYSTCHGITCQNPNHVLTQEYWRRIDVYLQMSFSLSFPLIGDKTVNDLNRCNCRDPANNFAIAASNAVLVSPTSPSAEKSSELCNGYACANTVGGNLVVNNDYYLYTNDTTADTCQCCQRQSTVLYPVQDDAVCGVLAPTEKWFALEARSSNYVPFTCESGGITWTQHNLCATSSGSMCYGDYTQLVDGTRRSPTEGYDVCANSMCTGWYCDSGYGLVQNYQRDGASTADPFTYNRLFAVNGAGDAYNAACYCGLLTETNLVTPGYTSQDMGQNNALRVYEGGYLYRDDDADCVADGYVCAASSNLHKSSSGVCYCCAHRDQPYYYSLVDETDTSMCSVAGFTVPSSSSSSPGSSGNGGGATPNPVLPASTFYTFLSNACPAGTLSGISETDLGANRNAVCCEYYSESDRNSVTTYCGDELLWVRQNGYLNCASNIPSSPFTCCAVVSADGAVSNNGRSCPATSGGDAASGALPTQLLLAAAATVIATLFFAW